LKIEPFFCENNKALQRWGLRPALCFLCLLIWLQGTGQDFKRQYKDAKELFAKEEYTKAMDAFKPLIVYDRDNPYSEYASYYYGLSAYKLGFATVAKDMLLQTRKLYASWDQIDEVNYLLAKIYFDKNDPFQALAVLKSIKNLQISLDAEAMKRHYLSRMDDVETLKMILEENPAEREGARALIKALAGQSSAQRDIPLFDSLLHKFQFEKEAFVSDAPLVSTMKDRYSISLMFPFLASTLDPSPGIKRNQFVLDLYEGMSQAIDSLHHENINLDLLAYDTERSQDVIKKLLETDELKLTDLIVGPLFIEESKLVLPFSEKNKINTINPVSNNSDFLAQDPFALLFQSSLETIGAKSAEMAAARVKNKYCIVYYGDSPKDSVMAFNFIRKAQELGLKIVLAEEIHKETSGKILTTLATPTDYDEWKNPIQFSLKRDSIGSVFVASDDPVIYSKAVSAAETRGDSVLVIGQESWIATENTALDLSIYERLGVTFAAPSFSTSSSPGYKNFHKKYVTKHGTLPSGYARTGYEFTMFIGHALHQYGVYFQEGLAKAGIVPGILGEGSNFPGTRDNQLVPFIKFREGELVVTDKR
jgi:ABC-type branched-subunit amino acid transport system substrate-binding protein